ncbi:MAG: glycosyltransferase [Patescibacteria group bacterium]
MKVAFVCDFLTKFGGAQRVLLTMHELFPDAPIYCLLYDEKGTKGKFSEFNVISSVVQKSWLHKHPKFLLSRFPSAVEQFDLSQFDMVISSSDSFAHGVITKPSTFHLCYCHTPMRYAWDWHNEYLKENNIRYGLKGLFVRLLLHKIRIWDRVAADRVDKWLSNSENVKNRIKKYYQKDATVLFPPIETGHIPYSEKSDDYYIIVSRLEPYKNVKAAVLAFNKMGKPLIIIGEGSEYEELAGIAKNNVRMLGWQDDKSVYKYLSDSKAFIFPVEDDFGMTPVEAMAAGKPVIALRKGGVLETVIEGKTGVFFNNVTPDEIISAVLQFEKNQFSPVDCRKQAEKFSKDLFLKKLKALIDDEYNSYKNLFR